MKKSKLAIISICCVCSFSSFASIEWDTEQGKLKLYGDVEFNLDAASKKVQLTSAKSSVDKDFDANNTEKWDVNGRILIGLDGYRELSNSNYAGFSVQPLADLSGSMNLDDAAFFFGNKSDEWNIKIGRFEAYNMFPLGQDTFVEHSGNTSNDIYNDGFGYIYQLKEARGRSGSGGSIQLTKNIDNFNFELNSMIKNGTTLFNGTYHGYNIENKKNVIYLRPVVSWRNNDFSIAAGMEANIIKNAYGYYNKKGSWVDDSKRIGYGLTTSWNSVGDWDKTLDGIIINASLAYMDADRENDFSAGVNINYTGMALGYIFANNDIKDFNPTFTNNGYLDSEGKYKIHTVYSSYLISDVMGMKNFETVIGAYWSHLSLSEHQEGKSQNRYGGRVRFKYYF